MGRKRKTNCKPAKTLQQKIDMAEFDSNEQIKFIITLLFQIGVVIWKVTIWKDQNMIDSEKSNFRNGTLTDIFDRFLNESISVLHDRQISG